MNEANVTPDTGVQGNADATPPGDETQDAPDTGLMGDEVKPDETKDTGLMGDEEAEGDKTNATPPGAPETYKPFDVSAGEDIKYALTPERTELLTKFGKENGLTDEQMAGILKHDIERVRAQKITDAEADKAQVVTWQAEARKEHGDKYSEVLANSKKVWDSVIMPAELKTLMKATDLRYNPHVLRLFNNISKHISEDAFVQPEQKTKGKNEGGINDMFSDLKKT